MKKVSSFLLSTSICFLFSLHVKAQESNVFGTTHLFQIGFFNENKGVAVGGPTTNAFLTPDGGNYWSTTSAFPNTMIRGLKVIRGTSNAVAVGQWRTIYKTENYGASWSAMIEAEGTTHFMSVDVRNGIGLAVGEGGKIYRATGLFTTTAIEKPGVEANLFIRNPVNDVLLVTSDVEVKNIRIIDLAGKIIREKSAATEVNVSDLSRGIYLLQIETTEGKTVRKIIKK
jgi:hypothetical protein